MQETGKLKNNSIKKIMDDDDGAGLIIVIAWCKNAIWETKVKQHPNLKNGTRR